MHAGKNESQKLRDGEMIEMINIYPCNNIFRILDSRWLGLNLDTALKSKLSHITCTQQRGKTCLIGAATSPVICHGLSPTAISSSL